MTLGTIKPHGRSQRPFFWAGKTMTDFDPSRLRPIEDRSDSVIEKTLNKLESSVLARLAVVLVILILIGLIFSL